MSRVYPAGTVFDSITSFQGGVNSGLNPLLLKPEELAFATNCTVRGAFITHRPPFQKLTLDFGGDEDLEAAVTEALFQGAMTYRPDFGDHLILLSSAGRLFKLDISGNTVNVSEISIPNDPNSPTGNEVWMWQAENFAIINDGLNLPIFFNGTSSRRSFGVSVVLATTAADFTPPAIGQTIQLTLTAPYTGPFDVPVIINGEFYQPIQNSDSDPTYDIRLTNLQASSGTVVPAGSSIYLDPSRIGFVVAFVSAGQTSSGFPSRVTTDIRLILNTVQNISVGDVLKITGLIPPPPGPFATPNDKFTAVLIDPATNLVVFRNEFFDFTPGSLSP